MHYVYILKSQAVHTLYIGLTNNLKRRLEEHNSGKSFATSYSRPWTLVYLEGYASEEDARHREYTLKQFGKVYSQLKRRIQKSINSAEKVRG